MFLAKGQKNICAAYMKRASALYLVAASLMFLATTQAYAAPSEIGNEAQVFGSALKQATSRPIGRAKAKLSSKQKKAKLKVDRLVRKFQATHGGGSALTSTTGAAVGFNLGHLAYTTMGCEGVTNLLHAGFSQGRNLWLSQNSTTSPWDDGRAFVQQPDDGPPETSGDQYAAMVLCPGAQGVLRPGKLIVTWDGGNSQSQVQLMWAARDVVSEGTNRLSATILPDANNPSILLRVRNPGGGPLIRNLRVVRSENEGSTNFFTQKFVDLLRGSGLRLLRMLNVSGANFPTSNAPAFRSMSWGTRVQPTAQLQGLDQRGIAFEHMVELARRVDADLYLTIPHTADDNFVSQMISLVDAQLAPHLRLFIEFSNEVWNSAFGQTAAALQEGRARGLQGANDQMTLRRAYGCRLTEIASVARQALSQRQSQRELGVVIAFQNANVQTLTDAATYRCPNGLSAREVAQYAASAPYFGNSDFLTSPANVTEMISLGLRGLLSRMALEADTMVSRFSSTVVPAVRNLGLIPVIYEGGTHLSWFGGIPSHDLELRLTRLFTQVVDNPAMYQIYRRYIQGILAAIPDGFYLDYRLDGPHNLFGNFGKLGLHHEIAAPGDRPRFDAISDIISVSRSNSQPEISVVAPQKMQAFHTEYMLIQGVGFEGTQVLLDGSATQSRQLSSGLLLATIPAGLPEGQHEIRVRRATTNTLSNPVRFEIKRPSAQSPPRITSANAGVESWQSIDTRYGTTLAIYGDGFSSLSSLLINGQAIGRAFYTVVRSDMILLNLLGELGVGNHELRIGEGSLISNPYTIRVSAG